MFGRALKPLSEDFPYLKTTSMWNCKRFGIEKATECTYVRTCVCVTLPTGESWETGRGWKMGRLVDHVVRLLSRKLITYVCF